MAANLEKLSADILDQDFKNIFRPIFVIQRALGSLSVEIKHGFATPTTKLYNFYSIFVCLVNISVHICLLFLCECKNFLFISDFTLKNFVMYLNVVDTISFLYVKFISRGTEQSDFYVKLQKIDRVFNMKRAKQVNCNLSKLSAFISVSIIAIVIVWTGFHNKYLFKELCPFGIFITFSSMLNYGDIGVMFFILTFILIRVYHIEKKLKEMKSMIESDFKSNDIQQYSFKETVNVNLDFNLKNLISGIRAVLTVVSEFERLFQFRVKSNFDHLNTKPVM